MVKYSIIVPVYNVELYLKECIDSILNQNFDDYELILVDDGSTDNCPSMCDEFAKKSKKVRVIHQKNGGLSAARNTGMKAAKGKYLLFVDSDDFVEHDYLNVIDKYDNGCDLLVFGFYDYYKNKRTCEYAASETLTKRQALSYLIADDRFGGYACNKVFRKEIIDKYNLVFDENVIMCEDILFSYNYIKLIEKTITIDKYIYNYRQRKSSLVSKRIKEINNQPIFETYYYLINDSCDSEIQKKSKALYLKYYYKFKKSISDGVVDQELIDSIIKNDYNGFSKHDKRLITMFKYVPMIRTAVYKTKGLLLKKYE